MAGAERERRGVTATWHARVRVEAGRVTLEGDLHVPPTCAGAVLFAHGSGSSRLSPRNRFVAAELHGAGLATLLIDLLSEEEDADHERRFDIPLLAERLELAARWLGEEPRTSARPLGLFGASTGAAAAIITAARAPERVRAVVSRGGRPDLAAAWLAEVRAPTLLIVGGDDTTVLELNRGALAGLTCAKELAVVRGASHLFEEPGTLEEVAARAAAWFRRHLAGGAAGGGAAGAAGAGPAPPGES